MEKKYIDAEKLISELTKMQFTLNASCRKPQSDNIVRAISLEYDDVISLITFLQEEQTEIEKEAEINPSMVSNFGPCAFSLSVMLTQEEMAKTNIAPFLTKKVNVIIKDTK